VLLKNGRIGLEGEYQWIEILDGRIERMGRGEAPKSGKSLDLNGALVLPGFCDSHTHLENIALQHSHLNLEGLGREEILEAVRERCPRGFVVGRGWDESLWDRAEYLTREEIDGVCKSSPVLLIREDGHLAVGNTKLLELLGFGRKDGLIFEEDVGRALRALGAATRDFHFAQDYSLSRGVTCVHDFLSPEGMGEIMRLRREGALKIRIFANFYQSSFDHILSSGLYSGFGDDFLRIGALKLFADGSIGAGTAATEYRDGRIVEPFIEEKDLRRIVERANSSGIRVFTHAIGDLAIERVLRAYRGSKGNRIEHAELFREEFFQMLDGVEISVQPNFLKWAKPGGLYHRTLPNQWMERNNPYRDFVDHGVKILFGSDCMPLDPLFGIRMATESEFPRQRLSLEEALSAYTRGYGYMTRGGELRPGYVADLVVLDSFPHGDIIFTMVAGRIMWDRRSR